MERERLLSKDNEFLQNGTLVIDLKVQVYVPALPVWYPPPSSSDSNSKKLLSHLLDTASCSDVTFKVDKQSFRLHRCILANRALTLFQMITSADQTITLTDDVDVETFQTIVRFIYTEEWPSSLVDSAEAAMSLLTASDRFGCTGLKLLVESVLVDKFLNESNAADMLLLGDARSCALLKEAAIDVFKKNTDAVMKTKGWEYVKESSALLAELVFANSNQSLKRQCVAKLRDRLLKRGLDVDDSREILVKRLKSADK